MEKNKLIIVSVSVGVFLLLVTGASILIFTPSSVAPAPIAEAAPIVQPGIVEVEPPPPPPPNTQDLVKVTIIEEPPAAPPVVAAVIEPPPPPPPPAPKPAPVAKPPVPKPLPGYWVQVGSYSVKSGADKVKADLDKKGLTTVITNSDVQGKTYYRVRVGPYESKKEADYWLKHVQNLDGFEKAQVWKAGSV